MHANSVDFSPLAIARARLVTLGAPGVHFRRVLDSVRSLKDFDHLSLTRLKSEEFARKTPAGVMLERAERAGLPLADELLLGLVRRWFWSRRRARGFVTEGFPSSVTQAVVFDDWLEARDESLTACVYFDQREPEVLDEASRAWMCPHDGSLYVEPDDALVVPGCCNLCRGTLEAAGPRFSEVIRGWFRLQRAAAEGVASYYRARGVLLRVSGCRSEDGTTDGLLRRISGLVVDR